MREAIREAFFQCREARVKRVLLRGVTSAKCECDAPKCPSASMLDCVGHRHSNHHLLSRSATTTATTGAATRIMPPQCKLSSHSPSSSSLYGYLEDDTASDSCGSCGGSSFDHIECSGRLAASEERRSNDCKSHELPHHSHSKSATAPKKPTNEYVLNVAFYSFLGFVLFQSAFALIAHSQSMLADSEAMSVDALTYLFNLGAERLKHRPLSEFERSMPIEQRIHRREVMRCYLELVPPLVSVAILFAVTLLTLKQAIQTLTAEASDAEHVDDDVSVHIMFFFSACNLTLDIVNVTCFARTNSSFMTLDVSRIQLERGPCDHKHHDCCGTLACACATRPHPHPHAIDESSPLLIATGECDNDKQLPESCSDDESNAVNLNMCSAYTHVFADTMRSSAVLLVAAIATFFPSIRPEQADAVAAIAVSIIILASLVPLLRGLWATGVEIVHLHRNPCSLSPC